MSTSSGIGAPATSDAKVLRGSRSVVAVKAIVIPASIDVVAATLWL